MRNATNTGRRALESRGVPASFDAARVPRFEVKAWEPGEFAARIDALLGKVA